MEQEIFNWIERLFLLAGGALGLELISLIKQRIQQKGDVDNKKTVDQTSLTEKLLDFNQSRYDSLITELNIMRDEAKTHLVKIEQLTTDVVNLRIENLHLRHLLGIGPSDPVPTSRSLGSRNPTA